MVFSHSSYNVDNRFYVSLTLNTETEGFNGEERAILRKVRTPYGKAIRKQYKAGLIREKRSNIQTYQPRQDGISNTLTTVQKDNYLFEPNPNAEPPYRVRKLTPLECWRLMGITDYDYNQAASVVAQTQLYRQAGNAIVVNVLEAIFSHLFSTKETNS